MGKKQTDVPNNEKSNLVNPKPPMGIVPQNSVDQVAAESTSQFSPEEAPLKNPVPPCHPGPSSYAKQEDPPQGTPLTPQQTGTLVSSHNAEQDKAAEKVSVSTPAASEDTEKCTKLHKPNNDKKITLLDSTKASGTITGMAQLNSENPVADSMQLTETNPLPPQPGSYSHNDPPKCPLPSTEARSFITSSNLEQDNTADTISDTDDSENVDNIKITPIDATCKNNDSSSHQTGPTSPFGVPEPGNPNPTPVYQAEASANSMQGSQDDHLSPQPGPSSGFKRSSSSPVQPGPSNSSDTNSSGSKRIKLSTSDEQAGNASTGETQERRSFDNQQHGNNLLAEVIQIGNHDLLNSAARDARQNNCMIPIIAFDYGGESEYVNMSFDDLMQIVEDELADNHGPNEDMHVEEGLPDNLEDKDFISEFSKRGRRNHEENDEDPDPSMQI